MKLMHRDPLLRTFLSPILLDDDSLFSNRNIPSGLDVYEDDGKVIVKAPVPGIKPKDVDVTYEDGVLTIKAHSQDIEEEKSEGKIIYKKDMSTSFNYATTLPRPVKIDTIEAKVKDGIVTVMAPISEDAKQKRIEVVSE